MLVGVGEEEGSAHGGLGVACWLMGSSSFHSGSSSEEPKTNFRQMSSSEAGVGDRGGIGGGGAAARTAPILVGVSSVFAGVVDSLSAAHHDVEDIFGSGAVYVRI